MLKSIQTDDTIVAISTPLGRSGIGIVRVSGRQAESIAKKFLKSKGALADRQATVGRWADENGSPIDDVVAIMFCSPNSYTGEDVLEISAHGNPLTLQRIVETARSEGARMAEPGEFTLRAVLNGKMDLIQAEAVRSFIDAQTEAQARMALLQISGALSKRIGPAKEQLIDVIAHLEAGIDFADDDVSPPESDFIADRIRPVRDALEELQKSYSYGKLLSNGLRLAIVGKPNVGKSSLFNRFIGADRAIVTNIPGTTRDVLSESIAFDGVPLRFSDTAGLHDTMDPVEKIGVERTHEALSEADLVFVVLDGAAGIDQADQTILNYVQDTAHIVVVNKCDLPQSPEFPGVMGAVSVSARTGDGMEDLAVAIRRFLSSRAEGSSDSVMTSARQFESLTNAIEALDKAMLALLEGTPHEMVLLDAYTALSQLNELTGDVVTDDILGRIFSTFCVGK